MPNTFLERILKGAVFLFIISFTSCENDEDLGLDVQPEGREIGAITSDTFSLSARQIKFDSVITDQNLDSYFGIINDPVFGLRKTSLISQVRLPTANIELGANFTIDSAFLTFKMDGFYGNIELEPLDFLVYSLNEDLVPETQYVSNYPISKSEVIGEIRDFEPQLFDSVVVFDGKEGPQMRIPLSNSFVTSLFNEDNFVSNDVWLEVFKGFVVEPVSIPSSGAGFFLLLDRIDALSRMLVYYQNSDTATETSVLSFPINAESESFSIISNDVSGSRAEQYLQNQDFSEDELLISSASGLGIEFLLKGLESFKNSLDEPIAINNAVLRIPLTNESINDEFFKPLGQVYPSLLVGDRRVMTPDYSEGNAFIDGSYDTENEQYDVNITRYVQWFIDDRLDINTLSITAGGGVSITDSLGVTALDEAILSSTIGVGRTILAGTSKNNTDRVKLIISYTPVNLN